MSSRADVLGALLEAEGFHGFEDAKHPRDFRGRWRSIAHVQSAHPDVSIEASERDKGIVLSKIETKSDARRGGKGSAALRDLLAYADQKGATVALTPEPLGKGGASRTALTKWYRSHGFVPNKGRAKDYAFTQSMVRQPQARVKESDRAAVLGCLLDARALNEDAYEAMVGTNQRAAGQVAREQKRLGSLPGPSSFTSSKHPRGAKGSGQGGKFIKKGSSGTPVKEVQKRLGVAQTGAFAFDTQAAVQNFQREHGLQVDGVVGAQTAQALLGNRNAKAVTPGALSSADAKALGLTTTSKSKGSKSSRKTKKAAAPKPSAPTRIGGGIAV